MSKEESKLNHQINLEKEREIYLKEGLEGLIANLPSFKAIRALKVLKTYNELKQTRERIHVRSVVKRLNLNKGTVQRYAYVLGLELYKKPSGRPKGIKKHPKRKPKVDKILKESDGEWTLKKIAKPAGLTRERIRQYIRETGQEKEFKEKRTNYKSQNSLTAKKRLKSKLADIVISAMYKKANPSEKRAIEFKYLGKKIKDRREFSFEKLVEIFDEYYKRRKANTPIVLKQMERQIGVNYKRIEDIIEIVNLEVKKYLKVIPLRFTEKQKEIMRRAVKTKLSYKDIEYFTGLPRHAVRSTIKKIKPGKRTDNSIKRINTGKQQFHLTYTKASQIYEALNARLNMKEICEYAETDSKIVRYVKKHKKEIKNKLIKELRIFYPDINKPYIDLKEKIIKS